MSCTFLPLKVWIAVEVDNGQFRKLCEGFDRDSPGKLVAHQAQRLKGLRESLRHGASESVVPGVELLQPPELAQVRRQAAGETVPIQKNVVETRRA